MFSGPRLPGKCSAPNVAPSEKTKCTLTWTPPPTPHEDDDEGPCESFEIEMWPSDVEKWTKIDTSTKATLLVTGLNPELTYKFRVRGVNKDGVGPYSPESKELNLMKGMELF